jgi:type I restriction enzyme M protein
MEVLIMAISTIIKSIQDIMRQDAGVDGDAQRISQLVWMIFLKIFDDKEKEWELEDDEYKSPIPEKCRWRNWAANKEGITGDELLDFIAQLFKTLKGLNVSKEDDPKGFIVREVFEDAYNYMKSGTLIRQVINKLNEVDFNKSEDRHLFNDIYEKILSDLQSAGNAGEYYTPRAVTQFIVDIVNPKLGEKVLDPACGTGGFLICSLENMKKKAKSDSDWDILQNNINGIEKKPLAHLLCTTNMILHGVEVPNIRHDNSLTRPLLDYGPADMIDCVVTNPPFGGAEEPGIESNFPSAYRTRETADLFLILITKLLRDEGRCGIVLPDGFLFGEGVKTRIKEKLLSEFNLHTIVRLPNGVFSPYTGIRTNLLFFEKDSKGTKEIWYFEHPLPEGAKTYNKTKPIRIEEFNLEKDWWKNRDDKRFKQYAWKVSIDDIKKKNYNLDVNNPIKREEEKELSREEIIEKIELNIKRTHEILTQIKRAR